MADADIVTCNFCGKHKDDVTKLIVGNEVGICNECVELCGDLLKDPEETKTKQTAPINSQQLKHFLDDHVVGQADAKIALSVAIINHYKRINNPSSDVEIDKANILMLGPTGSGKTMLAKTVARYLDVPFVIGDATSVTEAGYVGDDVESLIQRLLTAAGGDVARAERGIIFLDEVDKIARKSEGASITRDVSGEGVQQALLKLIEGTKCRIPYQGQTRKHPGSDMLEIDTKNILFICAGAFVGLEEIIKRRVSGTAIGFYSEIKSTNKASLDQVIPDDLVKFGLIPEFVGRLPVKVTLEELDIANLVRVLTEVKNNYLDQYRWLFEVDGIELSFSSEAIELIAQRSFDDKTGARGLHTQLENILMPHMYGIATYHKQGISKVIIDVDNINNPTLTLKEAV